MFGQPVVQLDPGTVGHPEIGDYNLVAARSRMPQFSEGGFPILRLIGFPASAAEIAGKSRPDRRLIIDDQSPPRDRDRSKAAGIGKDHEAWLKPRLMEDQGEPRGVNSSFFV